MIATIEDRADLVVSSRKVEKLLLHLPFSLPNPKETSDISGQKTLYCYQNLPAQSLLEKLDESESELGNIEYEVRDARTGEFIQIRTNEGVIRDSDQIMEYILKKFGLS